MLQSTVTRVLGRQALRTATAHYSSKALVSARRLPPLVAQTYSYTRGTQAFPPRASLMPITSSASTAQQRLYCASSAAAEKSDGEVETYEFKAETRKLLDIVARSLCTL
jgi:hypothetical protein